MRDYPACCPALRVYTIYGRLHQDILPDCSCLFLGLEFVGGGNTVLFGFGREESWFRVSEIYQLCYAASTPKNFACFSKPQYSHERRYLMPNLST